MLKSFFKSSKFNHFCRLQNKNGTGRNMLLEIMHKNEIDNEMVYESRKMLGIQKMKKLKNG